MLMSSCHWATNVTCTDANVTYATLTVRMLMSSCMSPDVILPHGSLSFFHVSMLLSYVWLYEWLMVVCYVSRSIVDVSSMDCHVIVIWRKLQIAISFSYEVCLRRNSCGWKILVKLFTIVPFSYAFDTFHFLSIWIIVDHTSPLRSFWTSKSFYTSIKWGHHLPTCPESTHRDWIVKTWWIKTKSNHDKNCNYIIDINFHFPTSTISCITVMSIN